LSEVIKAFDEASDTYDEWYRRPRGFQVFLSELRGLEALLPPSGLGAEVGAGTGIFAGRLTSEERRVVCIDPSPGMLKHAVGRALPAILSTGEECPFKRGSLAFAYMVTALEFMPDPVGALRSVGAALKAEAPLVTLTINRASPWGELYAEMAEKGDPIFSHARLYSFEEVHALLMSAGFEPREAVGTLTAAPGETEEEIRLVPVGPGVGVILIKARKRTHPPLEYPDHSMRLQRPRR